MSQERREKGRIPFEGKAYLTYGGRCRCEEVVDVSPEGLLLKTDARLKPGRPVKVFLPVQVGSNWRLCLLKGTVVRRQRGKDRKGVAVRLTPGEIDTRSLLESYIAAA